MDWGIAARPEAAARFGITVPSGFGSDLAGMVDEVGDGVTGFSVGDRVYGAPWDGPLPTSWWSGPLLIRCGLRPTA